MTQTSNTTDSFVRTAFFFETSLGVGALLVGWVVGVDPLATVPVTAGSLNNHLLAIFWGVVATLPLLIGLLLINQLQFQPLVRIRGFVAERVAPLFAPLSLFELAAISFAAGFGEEMLFRGLLQTGIAESIGGSAGIAPPSSLFRSCSVLATGSRQLTPSSRRSPALTSADSFC